MSRPSRCSVEQLSTTSECDELLTPNSTVVCIELLRKIDPGDPVDERTGMQTQNSATQDACKLLTNASALSALSAFKPSSLTSFKFAERLGLFLVEKGSGIFCAKIVKNCGLRLPSVGLGLGLGFCQGQLSYRLLSADRPVAPIPPIH